MHKKLYLFSLIFIFMAAGLLANENPEAVSPGHELRASIADGVCPTFSWAQVPGATAYQIAVFEIRERYKGLSYYESQAALNQPVLIKEIPGTASSWTPSMGGALQNGGRYVWFVQAQDTYGSGTWSVGKKFAVRAPLGLTEIKEKVKNELEARGIKPDLVDEAFEGIQSQDMKSKSEGELKGKLQAEKEELDQAQIKTLEKKEIQKKENQTAVGTGDFTAGALGEEGDANQNVYYGTGAGSSLSGGWDNSFFGYNAGCNTSTGHANTYIGINAGNENTSGYINTFVGAWAGFANTTAVCNTFIGAGAGYRNTLGEENTFVGHSTGSYNTEGNQNTFIGEAAGYYNTTADGNTFVGSYAGYNNHTGYKNTFIGTHAGLNSTGSGNVFLGYRAGYNETGSNKLYIGSLIYGEFLNNLVTINGELNVTASNINVDTTSTRARFKLQADGGGVNQDDFFNFTMRNDYGDVTLSVWDNSASSWLPMLSYEYLNNKVDFKNNDIVTTGTISSGGGAYTSGGAWIEASSRDYKENIAELDQAESLQALERLNPVRYNYKNKKDEEFLGFIAEDVPDLVAMNGRKGMRAMDIVAVLTKVVQEQQRVNEEQNKIINELKERIEELEHE